MIFVYSKDTEFCSQLEQELVAANADFQFLDDDSCTLEKLYQPEVKAIVADDYHPNFPVEAFTDCLESLAKKMPVVILSQKKAELGKPSSQRFGIWLDSPNVHEIITLLTASGSVDIHLGKVHREQVPTYNLQVPLQMLRKDGSLSVLTVQAKSFKKVALEYGADAYFKLQDAFEKLIFELWGRPGSFRAGDFLCRKEPSRNEYYIFLERSRSTQIPAPGALEKLADRVVTNLQQMMWQELMKPRAEKTMPSFLSSPPQFSVGYATCLHNPCVDEVEVLENLQERAKANAKVQSSRILDRKRELLQTLVQGPDLLYPHYQAVFAMDDVTDEVLEEYKAKKTLAPLRGALYGFESLIRVNASKVEQILDNNDGPIYLEPRFLRPDVLFALAHTVKLSLELDQACLGLGSVVGVHLPGKLMVNILPRNLYFIEQLYQSIPENMEIILELSESEAINNFELLSEVRDRLHTMNLGIAADDFGKGYAGLERVIKIKPDMIKLDRCLVQNIDRDPAKAAFVSGLVEAAKSSNSRILAEGVETEEEFRFLRDLGAHLIQGYFLHRPQSIGEIFDSLGRDDEEENETPLSTVA